MKIAVVGAGFTGLTACYTLLKLGHSVTLFEREDFVGGLAAGFKEPGWDWALEKTYHHLFTSDNSATRLMAEIGIADTLLLMSPVTSNYVNGKIYRFDSPIELLKFSPLSLTARLRTGLLAALCKIYPFWQTLEGVTAEKFVKFIAGQESWNLLWRPLLYGKFGDLADSVSAAWFWARIHKRTPKLFYIEGGYSSLGNKLLSEIKRLGTDVHLGTEILALTLKNSKPGLSSRLRSGKDREKSSAFDRILLTVPTPIAVKLLKPHEKTNQQLSDYLSGLASIPHMHAQVLILETKEPILEKVYWLNILDRSFPFLAVVAQTNLVSTRFYANHHLTYFGNYLPDNHPFLSMDSETLLRTFLPSIKRLKASNGAKLHILGVHVFNGFNAQPVHQRFYSHKAPHLITPLKNIYLANLDSIVPWDRGVNYAVELGEQAANNIG